MVFTRCYIYSIDNNASLVVKQNFIEWLNQDFIPGTVPIDLLSLFLVSPNPLRSIKIIKYAIKEMNLTILQ